MHKVFIALGGILLLAAVGIYIYETQPAAKDLLSVSEQLKQQKSRKRSDSKPMAMKPKGASPATGDEWDEFERARRCAAGMTQYCGSPDTTAQAAKVKTNRYGMQGRGKELYSMDEHSLDLAKRTAAIIGRKGKTSPQSLKFLRDIAGRAEKGCRFRDPLACWHRAELAQYSRDRNYAQWKMKAKVAAGEVLRNCGKKKSVACDRARSVQLNLAH